MIVSVPIQTNEIFDYLTKGYFISEDTNNYELKELYKTIENNYDVLFDYFQRINFYLEGKETGYFYFSKREKEPYQNIENKIKAAYKWIDVLDFLKTFGKSRNENFSQGYVFSPTDIFNHCKVNALLQDKLDELKKYTDLNIEKPMERIQKIVEILRKETFVDIQNEHKEDFKVLASFGYLENLISIINIKDEENETFE
jgi:hypothetical protein